MLYDIVFEGVHVESVYTAPELLDEYMHSAHGCIRDWYAAVPGEHHYKYADDHTCSIVAYEVDETPA